jgi:hypothetical protein
MAMIKKKTAAPAAKPEVRLQDRWGMFTLERAVMTDMPEIGIKVLEGVLVLGCTLNPLTEVFEYLGVSEHFEALTQNGEGSYDDIPIYEPEYDKDNQSVSWAKTE